MVDDAAPPAGWFPERSAFEHDAFYRLTSLSREGSEPIEQQRFAYDVLDNVLSSSSSAGATSPVGLGEYTYDPERPNAVASVAGIDFAYDAAGRVVRRGDLALTWDHEGRLVKATRDDAVVAEMAYGSGPMRIATLEGEALTLYVSADFEVRDGIGVLYGRLGDQRVGRSVTDALAPRVLGDPAPLDAPDGVVTAGDAWIGHAAAGGFVPADGEDDAKTALRLRSAARRLLAVADAGSVALHADHLGDLVLATDASGEERGRRRFALPTGEERSAGFVDVYGFGGQESIASLGLVRFAYRWLDPVTRRWMQPDPAATYTAAIDTDRADEAADPYAYVGNRFLAFTDPLGLARTKLTGFHSAMYRAVASSLESGFDVGNQLMHDPLERSYREDSRRKYERLFGEAVAFSIESRGRLDRLASRFFQINFRLPREYRIRAEMAHPSGWDRLKSLVGIPSVRNGDFYVRDNQSSTVVLMRAVAQGRSESLAHFKKRAERSHRALLRVDNLGVLILATNSGELDTRQDDSRQLINAVPYVTDDRPNDFSRKFRFYMWLEDGER
jgi:RHS repeat-associated protein